MILRQYLHFDPVAISYLFGCGGQSAAAVAGHVERFLECRLASRYILEPSWLHCAGP